MSRKVSGVAMMYDTIAEQKLFRIGCRNHLGAQYSQIIHAWDLTIAEKLRTNSFSNGSYRFLFILFFVSRVHVHSKDKNDFQIIGVTTKPRR